jgi:thiosulfate/3-mercaptopyruvate sulfurtransferase
MVSSCLVTTNWVAEHLDDKGVIILDGSHHLPTTGRNSASEYAERHISGARFFDIDGISDQNSDLPHMLPSADEFASKVGALGIGDDSHVVIYDTIGTTGAARVWWTFRAMGHAKVSVMDGGLPKWMEEGRQVVSELPNITAKQKSAKLNSSLVRSLKQMLDNIDSGQEVVVDARSAGRFNATEPEPRAGMRGGHIPGSRNVPFPDVLNKDRTFKSGREVLAAFELAGVDLTQPMVTTCGSGVTASTLALALFNAGKEDVAVYDGSWSEWGSRQDTPIDK